MMPETDAVGRLACPRCGSAPTTQRHPRAEGEATWCENCGHEVESHHGDSVELWNEVARAEHDGDEEPR